LYMGQSYISPKSPPEKHTFDLCLTHRPLTYSCVTDKYSSPELFEYI